jgi:GTP-binding protein
LIFVDQAPIRAHGGRGGSGCVAFRREKYVPRGGPSGGDGGDGGSVWLVGVEGLNTLYHLQGHGLYAAERGRHGEGSNRTGRSGRDLEVRVPLGTQAFDAATGELLGELLADGDRLRVARGGRGGRGNARFATSTNQAPQRADPGEPGEEFRLRLELKLLADVGLVGFPNVGKSTLISALSASRPKIADYPFTTLEPNLGVVRGEGHETFVMADIPGIIEGAHEGHGLGIKFLRHIERTGLLLHIIDVSEFSDRDPVEDYHVILRELESHSPKLLEKPMIVAANKIDACQDPERIAALEAFCRSKQVNFTRISAATGEGVDELRRTLSRLIREQKSSASPEAE